MNKLSIISIDAGKSYITYYMLKSLMSLNLKDVEVIVLCNTDNEYLHLLDEFKDRVKFIYDFNLVKSYDKPHLRHMYSFQYLLQQVNSEYIFLCDNDVIFTEKFKNYLDIYQNYDIIAEVEDYKNRIKYFIKDIYMYDNNIKIYDENETNIYVNNEYYRNLKLVETDNTLYKFNCGKNIDIELYNRFLPYYIFFNTEKIKSIPLFDIDYEIGYCVDKRKLYDSFSTITYNAIKNNFNIHYTSFADSIIHVRSSTWYRDYESYINRLKELNLL